MNILVTGASKGLGLQICDSLLSKGWSVYGISRTSNKNLKSLLEKYPNNMHWFKCDLLDINSLKKDLYDDFLKNIQFDGFVNNAAFAYDDIITNLNIERLESMFRVNVISPMLLTKFLLRNFILYRNKGSIVHVSSISVHTGYKGLSMYASTKGSLEAFSKNCAREWGSFGIRSNCVVAGFMETEMSSKISKEQKDRIYKRTSTKKPVSIKSVSETISFLLSKRSSSITGQNIFVDNGTI
tara:strand:- start:48 stop:767 length:720 start_codon:yes stop_codon:yes gene_type:complete